MNAEVRERRQPLLVDGVPEAQFGGDAIVEPIEQRQAVAPLGRRGQPEQFDGPDVLQERPVRGRRRVMELVDDHDVEMGGVEGGEPGGVQALDRREHVLERLRSMPSDPQLAEGVIAEAVAERRQALSQDLLAVRDEQQARARQALPKPRVVDRGHDRLAGSGRGDEQVSVVAALAGQLDLLEQALLERLRPELDRTQHDRRPRHRPAYLGCELSQHRTGRSRRCSSSSRRRRRPCRRRPDFGRPTRGRSTPGRSLARSA